jgi:hypothetical protein
MAPLKHRQNRMALLNGSLAQDVEHQSEDHYTSTKHCDVSPLQGRAMAQVVSRWPLTAKARVRAHVGFVVDKVALGQVFLRVLRLSPVNTSFHRRSPNSYHLGIA